MILFNRIVIFDKMYNKFNIKNQINQLNDIKIQIHKKMIAKKKIRHEKDTLGP